MFRGFAALDNYVGGVNSMSIEDRMFYHIQKWRNTPDFLGKFDMDLILCLERRVPLEPSSPPSPIGAYEDRRTSRNDNDNAEKGKLEEIYAIYLIDLSPIHEKGFLSLADAFGTVPYGLEEIVLIDAVPPSYCQRRGLPLGLVLRRGDTDTTVAALNGGDASDRASPDANRGEYEGGYVTGDDIVAGSSTAKGVRFMDHTLWDDDGTPNAFERVAPKLDSVNTRPFATVDLIQLPDPSRSSSSTSSSHGSTSGDGQTGGEGDDQAGWPTDAAIYPLFKYRDDKPLTSERDFTQGDHEAFLEVSCSFMFIRTCLLNNCSHTGSQSGLERS
jgi:hypothetical protein